MLSGFMLPNSLSLSPDGPTKFSEIGTLNQVAHIWAYSSHVDREKRRLALEADPAWTAFKETHRCSFVHQEVKILHPTSFSPNFFPDHVQR